MCSIDWKRFQFDPTYRLGIKTLGASVLVYGRLRKYPQIQSSAPKNPRRIGPNVMKLGDHLAPISTFTRVKLHQAAMNTSRDM